MRWFILKMWKQGWGAECMLPVTVGIEDMEPQLVLWLLRRCCW